MKVINPFTMHIGQFGKQFPMIKEIDFTSKQTLYDYDALVVDLNSICTYYIPKADPLEVSIIKIATSIENYMVERIEEIEDFFNSGKPILFCSFTPHELHFNDQQIDITELIPVEIEATSASGKRIEISSNSRFSKLFQEYKSLISYDVYFESFKGESLAQIKSQNLSISFFNKNLLFLPKVDKTLLQDLGFINKVIEVLIKKDEEITLPDWADKYHLPKEVKLQAEYQNLLKQQKELKVKINDCEETIFSLTSKKVLFTGSGNSLELKVKEVFKDLDFEILPTVTNRDDLIMKYGDRIIVAEIKGVTGTAAEKQAAQLEKWVSEYRLNNNKSPKALLIVNSFSNIELSKRTGQTWPHQMLDFSTRRQHCLITGIQLLFLLFECQNKPANKQKLIDELLNTDGIYKKFLDWSNRIDFKE